MKSLLLLPMLLVACASTLPNSITCPIERPDPQPQNSFQVLGEARTALWDSFDRMAEDEDAQGRAARADFILEVNSSLLVGRNPKFQNLAACSAAALADVLPDMAMFAKSEDAARVKRAYELFAAMGGTCPEPLPGKKIPTGNSDPEEDNESIELGPSSGDETSASLTRDLD